ncbi:putative ammonium transporter 1 [Ischnura elegans]|uniref:putative ammonium transporter 1 n=1 Tax=Ischnura elegans TaxID=197161 RepID=UPI001ED8BA9F|nr:putative ammonium transporter 1 [Ischnura elegans]
MPADSRNLSLADEISRLEEHLDSTFLFLNGISICLMQLGFACVEVGSVRKKNSVSVLMKNVLDMFICSVTFWLVGYSLAFGTGNPFLGLSLWDIDSLPHRRRSHWFFQLSFAAAASTIVSGAVAERCTLLAYAIYTTFISGLIYPIVVHWTWSPDGWLSILGYRDLAGSGVVHLLGGSCALVGAIILGSRLGRFEDGVTVRKKQHSTFTPCSLACLADPIPGHSTLMVGIGGMLLAVTFLSFNGASIGKVTGGFEEDANAAAVVAVNTILGGSGGAIIAICALKVHSYRYPNCCSPPWDLGITVNAALTGMVSLCAGADVLSQWASLCTGLIAGLVYLTSKYIVLNMKVDDPTDVASVHLGGGLWGVLARPLFTIPYHIIFNHDISKAKELLYNLTGAITITLWSTCISFLVFTLLKKGKLLRVTAEHEILGLDSSYEMKRNKSDAVAMQTISCDDLTTTESV